MGKLVQPSQCMKVKKMLYNVTLRRQNNRYIAKAEGWPEITVIEDSRDAAIEQLKVQLTDYLNSQVEIVQVEVPLPEQTGNPWLDKFGWFKDDPTFDDLQAEIAVYRKELERETHQTTD